MRLWPSGIQTNQAGERGFLVYQNEGWFIAVYWTRERPFKFVKGTFSWSI
jgi:hypothetical protein